MPKEKMWVEWKDGTHLSQSQKKPGGFSALTRDDVTNELGPMGGSTWYSSRTRLDLRRREWGLSTFG